ncbi:Gldg family protein [Gillisia sp. M10.2A]|uniref:Gldg family protein n=1 Tax=Gillisia lutea TaxID=2909668 RepID=A0ABS9EDB9_9FLAO|nr:Gldg family protein [Gillisia lutea]MCF4100783.1 Gldg family protein [Gillisia lutea]
MKKIFRIARLELSILFYSPIAWLILIIFIVQTGLTFTELLYSQETNQQLGRPLNVLSKVLFAGEDGILATVQRNLYLYIPLLTMGLFSRETSSGSFKLLLSSPVSVSQIVFGKFLSMMGYAFLLCLILASFIISGLISIEALDIKFVLGGVFGIYLLICAYSAIGLFMSSLTTYQVVAAISTLAILAALNFVGNLGQSYDFVRDITYWLSISGRADNFVNGLVSSKDIIYFLLVIGLFISLAILKLKDERKSRTKPVKIIRYTSLILMVVAIGYISSLPTINVYYDSTRFKDRTLTETSQEIVTKLNKPVNITTYVNVVHYSAGYGAPKNRIKDLNQFEQYRRFLPEMEMKYVTYYDTLVRYNDTTKTLLEKAKRAASAHKFNFDDLLSPVEIKEKINLIPEDNRLVRILEYNGKSTPLRMFDDMLVYPKEAEISAALKRLVEKPGLVGVISGNGERGTNTMEDGSYKIITKGLNVRGSLLNQGFDIVDIPLNSTKEIPENLDVLVLADPKKEYSPAQIDKISHFIKSGGNLMIAGEPDRRELINPILKTIGLKLIEGTLLQETENYEYDLIQGDFTSYAPKFGQSFYEKAIVSFPGAGAIIYNDSTDFDISPILVSDPTSVWNKLGDFDLDTQKIEFDPATDQKNTAALAVALERQVNGKNQKIMVFGDADFMGNSEMTRNNLNTVNSSFVVRMFRWFSNGKYPVNTARPAALDKTILVSRSEIEIMKGIYAGLFPVLIGGLGMFILIRRKRQ